MSYTAENVTATAEPVTESPAVEKVIEKAPGSSELLSLAKREATFRKQEADYKTNGSLSCQSHTSCSRDPSCSKLALHM